MKDIQIRILKANNPNINTDLFEGYKANKITEHLIKEYPGLTFSLSKKNSFYQYLYTYLEMIKEHDLNEIFTRIAQDYQTFDINAYPMN